LPIPDPAAGSRSPYIVIEAQLGAAITFETDHLALQGTSATNGTRPTQTVNGRAAGGR